MQNSYFVGKVPDRSEPKDELERCCSCDEPTGRAGRADDSLYCECGAGPFCEDCWDEHECPETGGE